jgi:hypothetical protein
MTYQNSKALPVDLEAKNLHKNKFWCTIKRKLKKKKNLAYKVYKNNNVVYSIQQIRENIPE